VNRTFTLGLIGFTCVLAGCGGQSSNSPNSGGAGTTGSTGGASASLAVNRACSIPSDCVIQSLSCCASCGAPSPTDYTAMNRNSQYDYQRSACANTPDCAACNAQVGIAYLVATCEQGLCTLIDLREAAVTACSNASECYVRAPECSYSVIALSSASSVAYTSLVCSPNQACAYCAPIYPTVNVGCIAGHCRVVN